jgi:hypothetical protein
MEQDHPHVASFDLSLDISIKTALTTPLTDLFHRPLTESAYTEFQIFSEQVVALDINNDHDKWTYSRGNNFFVSKAYATFMTTKYPTPLHPAFSWLWKPCCQQKHRVFCWLLLQVKH